VDIKTAKTTPNMPGPEDLETITPLPGQEVPPGQRSLFELSPINLRRWNNFTANRRGFWSLWIFLSLFFISLFAEFVANDRPIIASYKSEILFPIFVDYPEEKFGGFLATTDYRDPFIQNEIEANGWLVWPPIRYSYTTRSPCRRRRRHRSCWTRKSAASAIRRASTMPIARRGTGTGWAPTTRPATLSRGSSTAFAFRCCSASS
jgi:hypothetical protein